MTIFMLLLSCANYLALTKMNQDLSLQKILSDA